MRNDYSSLTAKTNCLINPVKESRLRYIYRDNQTPKREDNPDLLAFARTDGAILESVGARTYDCDNCNDCKPVRVNTSRFTPSRRQKRIMRDGEKFHFQMGLPHLSEDYVALYYRHNLRKGEALEKSISVNTLNERILLNDSCATLVDPSGKLVAHSLFRQDGGSLAGTHKCFDPELSEDYSLGVLIDLKTIEYAQEAGIEYFYLGTANLKADYLTYLLRYDGCEIFSRAAQEWVPVPRAPKLHELERADPSFTPS